MGEILFLAHRVPWPPNRGDKIRSHHFLQKLMDCAPVHVACFADDENEKQTGWDRKAELASCEIVVRNKPKWRAGIEALASGKPVSLVSFESVQISTYVAQAIDTCRIDCIFVFSGQMAQFIPPEFAGRVVMDFADVDSAKFESYADEGSGPMAWINRREGRLLRTFEKTVAGRADHSLFVSEAEALLFRQRSGLSAEQVKAVGNGIDLEFYGSREVQPEASVNNGPLILFTGQMDYQPNVQAVQSFSTEVMPNILAHFPDARFAIVGRAPSEKVTQLDGRNGTIVTGAVDDIRSWIAAADVVVAPLRIARGIQNKVLEAMAMAKPVVASACAAEGIEANDDEHFLIAQSVAEEARLVCDLLGDPERAGQLGEQARSLIHSHYSWETQLVDLSSLCGFQNPAIAEAVA
ncbi:TIGR03087 family PEP-CTERM/XrtA system glycosyltransferase [uncultured Parasphingorhabdus sp.]|uniref:TIGR03087 family PEP-CTERM/XrtA system glycosyltransferase n=1 Tax=uncultured Parasphingorhabdus sp. TaxID=2709694 RepID=UPI0030D724A9|tara:strand:+ start:30873 stop:32096 length:1224 start_codon:yes stop_codon:yes gene_type:complete